MNPYDDMEEASSNNPVTDKNKINIKSLKASTGTKRPRTTGDANDSMEGNDCVAKKSSSVNTSTVKVEMDKDLVHLEEEIATSVIECKVPEEVRPVDFTKSISTLSSHLNNIKKFPKAVHLSIQLIGAKFTSDKSSDLVQFLEKLFSNTSLVNTDQSDNKVIISSIKELMVCVWTKYSIITTVIHQYSIFTWYLKYFIRYELSTDDSFLFFKTCQSLQSCIEELPKNSLITQEGDLVADGREVPTREMYTFRLTVILECLTAAYKNYFRAWAKSTLDALFQVAAHHRLAFPPDLRQSLDELTTAITLAQRKSTALGGNFVGGSERTIRTYNSTTHPLLQKKNGILR